MTTYEIREIWRYPVKSMGGESIPAAELSTAGVSGDRQWALRSTDSGKIVSAKRPRPYGALLDWSATLTDDGVVVTGPGGATFEAGAPDLDAAVSSALGEAVSFAPMVEGAEETYDSEWPEIPGTSLSETEAEFPIAMLTGKASFVDVSALHLLVADSMAHLGTLLPDVELDVRRFRPSMVLGAVDGGHDGFADLAWTDVSTSIGSVELWIGAPAPRCVMTTLPQGGLERANGILKALAAHGKHSSDFGTFACLGTYAEVTAPGTVAVGDRLDITLD
ncbi:MAG: MOSC N-terminal beta barrel domain-containing protein [Actinomycetota bacterium]